MNIHYRNPEQHRRKGTTNSHTRNSISMSLYTISSPSLLSVVEKEGKGKGPCDSLGCALSCPTPPLWFPILGFHVLRGTIYERLSKLLVRGQTMDVLGGSYRFTRIPSHVSVRYRFALVKIRRPSDSLILLVACPALYCPLLPFTTLYCLLLSFTCPLLLFTAFYYPLRPFTTLYCPSLPFTALYCPLLYGAVAHKTIQ